MSNEEDKRVLINHLKNYVVEKTKKIEDILNNLTENEKKQYINDFLLNNKVFFSGNEKERKKQEKECLINEIIKKNDFMINQTIFTIEEIEKSLI